MPSLRQDLDDVLSALAPARRVHPDWSDSHLLKTLAGILRKQGREDAAAQLDYLARMALMSNDQIRLWDRIRPDADDPY